jgi:hypothetical protein
MGNRVIIQAVFQERYHPVYKQEQFHHPVRQHRPTIAANQEKSLTYHALFSLNISFI